MNYYSLSSMSHECRPARKRKGPTARKRPPDEVLSARYTPPTGKRPPRFRPVWHKAVGALQAAVGATMVIANYAALLPGGHKEAYFFVGMPLAVASSWWFGLFDPPM
jgi:hypothetical protein